jgi:hypothetical protein
MKGAGAATSTVESRCSNLDQYIHLPRYHTLHWRRHIGHNKLLLIVIYCGPTNVVQWPSGSPSNEVN